ncbi:MAG TPA: murein biosynthesis integral membrane protein MurJ [Acidimicrobiales bacterium]|nr:murein biosynthesis integral membrane protein MurJ [Acidimicrobiales bacterium]
MSGGSAPPAAARLERASRRRARLARASVGTGLGTLLSRATGLVRLVVAAYALGGLRLADAFNLANNTPNMVHDLVLGGVLAATFVPVFVDQLATRPLRQAEASMSAVVTLAGTVLVAATVLLVLGAPAIIDLLTLGRATPTEHAIAVTLLRLFAPQLLFYGAISIASALLATKDRFGAVGFAPVVNNVVAIVVLAVFAALAGRRAVESGAVLHDRALIAFLGVGTTAGVALQALALVPALRRAKVRVSFRWRPRDPAVRAIVALSGWTFGFVVANQVALFVVLAMEFHLGTSNVTAYTYGFTFFQLPFAVVAVSVINVASPDLARLHTAGRLDAVGRRLGVALRQTLAFVLPAAVGYLVLARPIVTLTLEHGAFGAASARLTASVLAMFALGLPGFCTFFLAVRALQAMRDTRTAFVLYVLENGTNLLAAALLYHPLGARGLALAYSIAYTVGAGAALAVLRERLGTIGGRRLLAATARSAALSLLMAFAVALVSALLGAGGGAWGWLALVLEVAVGAAVYLGGAGVAGSLASWQTSRHTPSGTRGARGDRNRHRRGG